MRCKNDEPSLRDNDVMSIGGKTTPVCQLIMMLRAAASFAPSARRRRSQTNNQAIMLSACGLLCKRRDCKSAGDNDV